MPKQAAINAQAISELLCDSRKRWELLAKQIDADSILKSNGTLYFYQTKSSYELGK
jgi:hypothetical protein